jgi:hypothetical protein
MPACQFDAGPEELAALGTAFHEAWRHVGPIYGPSENPHREWLARLILGLRRSGHSGDIALLAIEQFMATAPLAEWADGARSAQQQAGPVARN